MRVTKITSEGSAFRYDPAVRDLILGVGHGFYFNQRSQRFELDQNPFGDPNLVTMNNVVFSSDFSQLTFDAKYQRKQQQFGVTAANEQQRIMFEFFARLNEKGFATEDDEADDVQLLFEKGKLEAIRIYKQSKDCELLDSLRIVGEAGQYSLIKQAPWRKFALNSIVVDNHKVISRSAGEEFVFNLNLQSVIFETVKKLVESSVLQSSAR